MTSYKNKKNYEVKLGYCLARDSVKNKRNSRLNWVVTFS